MHKSTLQGQTSTTCWLTPLHTSNHVMMATVLQRESSTHIRLMRHRKPRHLSTLHCHHFTPRNKHHKPITKTGTVQATEHIRFLYLFVFLHHSKHVVPLLQHKGQNRHRQTQTKNKRCPKAVFATAVVVALFLHNRLIHGQRLLLLTTRQHDVAVSGTTSATQMRTLGVGTAKTRLNRVLGRRQGRLIATLQNHS